MGVRVWGPVTNPTARALACCGGGMRVPGGGGSRLAKANEDRRAAEVERDALCRDKAHLTAKVKTFEWEAAQQARAAGGKAPGSTVEGEAEGPTAEKGGGGTKRRWHSVPPGRGAGMACAG